MSEECSFVDEGVKYGVSDGIVVFKSISGPALENRTLPFNLRRTDSPAQVRKKLNEQDVKFVYSGSDYESIGSSDLCVTNRLGEVHEMVVRFGVDGLHAVEARANFP